MILLDTLFLLIGVIILITVIKNPLRPSSLQPLEPLVATEAPAWGGGLGVIHIRGFSPPRLGRASKLHSALALMAALGQICNCGQRPQSGFISDYC